MYPPPIFSVIPFSSLPFPCHEPDPYKGTSGDLVLGPHVFPFITPIGGARLSLKPTESLYMDDVHIAFLISTPFSPTGDRPPSSLYITAISKNN